MEVFHLDTDYDAQGNSPWDTIWYDGDYEDIDVLDCDAKLAAIWKPPNVRVEERNKGPDFFVFQTYFAVTERVRVLLLHIVQNTVEFLPLSTDMNLLLFVLHPFIRVDLDDGAVVSRNSVSGNVTVIRKYSFAPNAFDELQQDWQQPIHVFQVRHPLGSSARDGGVAVSGLLVSREFVDLCKKNNLQGVTFKKVFPQ